MGGISTGHRGTRPRAGGSKASREMPRRPMARAPRAIGRRGKDIIAGPARRTGASLDDGC
jgi:hypothetical protein